MDSASILQLLKDQKAILQTEFGVEDIAIFGSVAKGSSSPESDVDILVNMGTPNYTNYHRLKVYLENILHQRVDLIRRGPHLSKQFLQSIESQIIYV